MYFMIRKSVKILKLVGGLLKLLKEGDEKL